MEETTMVGKASGIYKEFLDNTRGEYERVMYGRRTTEELDVLEETPEQSAVGETGVDNSIESSIENPTTQNNLNQNEQEMDNDMDM